MSSLIVRGAARRAAVVALGAALLASAAAHAHHSPAVFDRSREVVIEGVVTEFRWGQPHSWIHMDVERPEGESEKWTVEMDPASHLRRRGWNARTISPGDRVAVTVHPLRNGEVGGQYVMIELPDGTLMDAERSGPEVVD